MMEVRKRRYRPKGPGGIAVLPLLLALVLLPAAGRAAQTAAESGPPTAKRYHAQLMHTRLTAKVGHDITLSFTLDPPKRPQGLFLSVNMHALEKPKAGDYQEPEILTGFPETRIVFHTAGVYRYAVVVSLVAKSSCGGAEAHEIYNGEVRIVVDPQ